MLVAENVDLYYGAAKALRHVSLRAETGKVTALMGRNGVGKTPFLRAVIGEQPCPAPSPSTARRWIAWPRTTVPASALDTFGRHFSAADRQGESGDRLRRCRARRARSLLTCSICFRCWPTCSAARWRPVRRSAAAACYRPRAGHASEATGSGRAHRGHPAVDHQGHRPRHRVAAPAGTMAILLVEQYFDFVRQLADTFAVMDRGEIILTGTRDELISMRRHSLWREPRLSHHQNRRLVGEHFVGLAAEKQAAETRRPCDAITIRSQPVFAAASTIPSADTCP